MSNLIDASKRIHQGRLSTWIVEKREVDSSTAFIFCLSFTDRRKCLANFCVSDWSGHPVLRGVYQRLNFLNPIRLDCVSQIIDNGQNPRYYESGNCNLRQLRRLG